MVEKKETKPVEKPIEKVKVEAKSETKPVEKPIEKVSNDTYIMKVTRLDWGANSKNHFYADKKPLISEKKMGKFASTLKIWLKKGWIEKGSYKK